MNLNHCQDMKHRCCPSRRRSDQKIRMARHGFQKAGFPLQFLWDFRCEDGLAFDLFSLFSGLGSGNVTDSRNEDTLETKAKSIALSGWGYLLSRNQ